MRRSIKIGIFAVVAFIAMALGSNWPAMGPPLMEAVSNSSLWLILLGLAMFGFFGYYVVQHYDIKFRKWVFSPLKSEKARMLTQEKRHNMVKEWLEKQYHLRSFLKALNAELTLIDSAVTPHFRGADTFEVMVWSVRPIEGSRASTLTSEQNQTYITSINLATGDIDLLPRRFRTLETAFEFMLRRFELSKPQLPRTSEQERLFTQAVLQGVGIKLGSGADKKQEDEHI